MGFETYYRNAIKVCERLGTWVLYDVRDARDLQQFVGYLNYAIDDLERLKQRTGDESKRQHFSQLIGFWRRAVRWVSSLDRTQYALLAERIIDHLTEHPEHRRLPYYVANSGHRSLTTKDKPPRRAGRPRTRASAEKRVRDCSKCGGLGFVPTS